MGYSFSCFPLPNPLKKHTQEVYCCFHPLIPLNDKKSHHATEDKENVHYSPEKKENQNPSPNASQTTSGHSKDKAKDTMHLEI